MSYVMHLEVESAGVADGVAVFVASPQRRHIRLAVCARRPSSPSRRLQRRNMQPYLLPQTLTL